MKDANKKMKKKSRINYQATSQNVGKKRKKENAEHI